MPLRALTCPHCGAPLPTRALRAVVVCMYCQASVAEDGGVVHAVGFHWSLRQLSRDDGVRPRVEVAGLPYRVLGRVAQGESSDAFLAERAHPITERVILKVLRCDQDQDLLDHEWSVLNALSQINPELGRRLPPPVSRGRLIHEGGDGRPALVVRASSGFVDTLEDVRRAYPGGVDGRHGVWLWNRILELLAGLHQSGWVHGAILPQHLVVHARDHGVMVVGWSCARKAGSPYPPGLLSAASRGFYAPSVVAGDAPTPGTDIQMSARCVAWVLGGSAEAVPPSVPGPLRSLVEAFASSPSTVSAWDLRERVGAAAREAYGRRTYFPLTMPGWKLGG